MKKQLIIAVLTLGASGGFFQGCFTHKEKAQLEKTGSIVSVLETKLQSAIIEKDYKQAEEIGKVIEQIKTKQPLSIGEETALFLEGSGVPILSTLGAIIFSLYQMERRKRFQTGFEIVTEAIEEMKPAKIAVENHCERGIGDKQLVNKLLAENNLGPFAK